MRASSSSQPRGQSQQQHHHQPHRPSTGPLPVSSSSRQRNHHSSSPSSSHHHSHHIAREQNLSVEELVATYGENLVRRCAEIHGAKFSELSPEGTLKTLAGGVPMPSEESSSSSSKKRKGRHHVEQDDAALDHDDKNNNNADEENDDDEYDNNNSQHGGISSPHRPLTKSEFNSAKKHAAWAVAEEECQRLLSVVLTECETQMKKETDKEKAARAAENRLGQIQHRHQQRMKREKLQFAQRLKHSIESTRNVMQRVKEEGEAKRRQFEEEQRREEEEQMQAVGAFKSWQKEMRRRADEAERARKIREEQRKKERELQHWKENQAEMHQWEIQQHATEKRTQEQRAKSAAGRRRFVEAMKIRQEQRKEAERNDTEGAVEKLHDLEEQERSAHERWRTYQNYTRMRSMESSSHVNAVRNRAKQIEDERLKAAEDRRRRQEEKMGQWNEQYRQQRNERRQQFQEERRLEKEAKKKAEEAEHNRKMKAKVTLEWLSARSEQQIRVLDQQRAVKQYEQHVMNAAMKRRADRAKKARELRNEQTQAEWSTKMEQGDARSKQREAMSRRARLEKERLAVLAAKMRWQASTGKDVDMQPIDHVLQKIEKDASGNDDDDSDDNHQANNDRHRHQGNRHQHQPRYASEYENDFEH